MTAVENSPKSAENCPFINYSDIATADSPALAHFNKFDQLRDEAPLHFGDALGQEFWLATRMADMREAYQNPQVFSSSAISMWDADPQYMWIPEMLDPPIHTTWRQLLGGLFSPGAINKLEGRVRGRFLEILDTIADRGECEFVQDVALLYPNVIFMELMGLPVEDAAQFQIWETEILHLPPTEAERSMAAMGQVNAYFADLIAARRIDPKNDIVTIASGWKIEGKPVSDDDLQSLCLLLFMAGLDTVAMQLSYSFMHLATHDEDRRRIVADPSLIPGAIEEFVRYYSFVTPGRKIMSDTEIAGCPVRAGQMLWLPLVSANRDPAEFPDADKVIIDRKDNRHVGFGAGPHRCLGAHLARQELNIALQEWHKRIPNYRLTPGVEIREHGAGQIGLNNLSLEWDV
ncbi:MAG: cytochrome [Frankiales bacterium]|nr:cytochrome [Frankiales bacterium]